jgi:hypothetical protein
MTILLADRCDERRVVELEKQKWLHEVLVALGADATIVEAGEMEAKDHLAALELEVWENADGTIDIHRRGKFVAQWKQPKFILVKETADKWYYEIHTNEWAQPFQAKKGEKR